MDDTVTTDKRSSLARFLDFLKIFSGKRAYVAKRPHLVMSRTVGPIAYQHHKGGKKGGAIVPLLGVVYDDRSKYPAKKLKAIYAERGISRRREARHV